MDDCELTYDLMKRVETMDFSELDQLCLHEFNPQNRLMKYIVLFSRINLRGFKTCNGDFNFGQRSNDHDMWRRIERENNLLPNSEKVCIKALEYAAMYENVERIRENPNDVNWNADQIEYFLDAWNFLPYGATVLLPRNSASINFIQGKFAFEELKTEESEFHVVYNSSPGTQCCLIIDHYKEKDGEKANASSLADTGYTGTVVCPKGYVLRVLKGFSQPKPIPGNNGIDVSISEVRDVEYCSYLNYVLARSHIINAGLEIPMTQLDANGCINKEADENLFKEIGKISLMHLPRSDLPNESISEEYELSAKRRRLNSVFDCRRFHDTMLQRFTGRPCNTYAFLYDKVEYVGQKVKKFTLSPTRFLFQNISNDSIFEFTTFLRPIPCFIFPGQTIFLDTLRGDYINSHSRSIDVMKVRTGTK